jgi:hypothetical protein
MAWEGAKLRSIANTKAMLTDPFSHNTIRKDVVEEELMIVEYRIESLYCNIALVLFGANQSPVSSATLQRQNAENLKKIFPEKEYWGLSPNFHIHVSVSELPLQCSQRTFAFNSYTERRKTKRV